MPLILRGMLLIARGDARGLNCFRDTVPAFLQSLTPCLALMIAATVKGFAEGDGAGALIDIPVTLCVLLMPAVISYELARLWGRDAFWGRYIVAFNWCQWLLPLLLFAALIVLALLRNAGLGGRALLVVAILALACYSLWLNWFLARHGLALSGGRAAALVAVMNATMVVIALGIPWLAEQAR